MDGWLEVHLPGDKPFRGEQCVVPGRKLVMPRRAGRCSSRIPPQLHERFGQLTRGVHDSLVVPAIF